MEQWILIFGIVALCIAPFYLFREKGIRPSSDEQVKVDPKRFYGVTIKPCANACQNAILLQRKRYLASEVPLLPLNGCERSSCQCTYKHHADRRSGGDRRYPTQAILAMDTEFLSQNRRAIEDRRRYYA